MRGGLGRSARAREAMSAEGVRARLQQAAREWLARRGVERELVRCSAELGMPGMASGVGAGVAACAAGGGGGGCGGEGDGGGGKSSGGGQGQGSGGGGGGQGPWARTVSSGPPWRGRSRSGRLAGKERSARCSAASDGRGGRATSRRSGTPLHKWSSLGLASSQQISTRWSRSGEAGAAIRDAGEARGGAGEANGMGSDAHVDKCR